MRVFITAAVILLLPNPGRAETLPTFWMGECNTNATHVIVVDSKGTVLESWRGDLKPGANVPLKDFRIKLDRVIYDGLQPRKPEERVTGNRLVLFLTNKGTKYSKERPVAGWAAAHWCGDFDVSVAWVEKGIAYVLHQPINPGPLVPIRWVTEEELKKSVTGLNKAVERQLARARGEKDLAARAKLLAGIVIQTPGLAAPAFGGLEWCGADGVPALRSITGKELIGDPERIAAYRTLALVGGPARDDLLKLLNTQLKYWKDYARKIEYSGRLEPEDEGRYRILAAATSNPAAFAQLTPAQRETVRDFREFWAKHPVLSKLGESGDRIQDRLGVALASDK